MKVKEHFTAVAVDTVALGQRCQYLLAGGVSVMTSAGEDNLHRLLAEPLVIRQRRRHLQTNCNG